MKLEIIGPLIRWLIFSVLIALVPLGFTALSLTMRGLHLDLYAIIGQGELFLIAAMICAAAAGELFGSNQSLRVWKIVCGGICVILLLFSALNFADVTAARLSGESMVFDVLRTVSLTVYGASVVVGACSKVLAEMG